MDSGISYVTHRKYPSGPARNKLRSFRARKTRFAFCALHVRMQHPCCIRSQATRPEKIPKSMFIAFYERR